MNKKLAIIELLLLDVDGVLTSGEITYNDDGREIKSFSVKDGLGIRLLMDAGIKVGIVTARKSPALRHRLDNLKIELVWDGVKDKAKIFDEIVKITGIEKEKIAFMGDDLPDLKIMKKAALAISPPSAAREVKDRADIITENEAGQGAVREICEAILKAKNLWEEIVEKYEK